MLMINPAFHDAFVIILGTLILVSLLTASRLITHIPEELDESRKATENLWMLRWTRNVSYGSELTLLCWNTCQGYWSAW